MTLAGRKLFALTTDLVIFALDKGALKLLLIRRANAPFEDMWALPGGFLEDGETLEECAARELHEETGLEMRQLEQLAAFSAPGRDPRGDVVSVAYIALVRSDGRALRAGSDAREAKWIGIDALPDVAFDHDEIILTAREFLTARLYHTTAAFNLLPDSFTLADVQHAFESISGDSVDKRNFRSWIKREGLLRETGKERRGAHRPAKLYAISEDNA